ncbi:MAG: A24 family peptidase [Gammaproteobacteria bacterium]
MPTIAGQLLTFALICYLLAAVFTDVRSHRIPNQLSLSAIAVAFVLQLMASGATGLLAALAGLGVGLIMFLPFYAFGGMGAGDVKAMAAAGSFLGPLGAFLAAGLALVTGSGIAMILFMVRLGDRRVPQHTDGNAQTAQGQPGGFPYAGAIAIGCFVALLYLGRLPTLY